MLFVNKIKRMSIENSNIIDFCSLGKQGNVELTISDHLMWDDTTEHLLLLQSKINAYLSTIESGELFLNYPSARDKKVVIGLVMKYWPNPEGHQFLEKVKGYLESSGYDFYYKKLVVDD
jgi:hypothetical protein